MGSKICKENSSVAFPYISMAVAWVMQVTMWCHIFNSTRFLYKKIAVIIAYGIRAREQSAEVQIYWKLKDRINTFHYYSAICPSVTSQHRPVGCCWDLQENIKCSPLSQHCNYTPSAPQLPYKHIITFILLSFNYPPLSLLLPRIPRGLLSASVYKFLSYFGICRTSVKGVEENSWVWNDALQKGLSQHSRPLRFIHQECVELRTFSLTAKGGVTGENVFMAVSSTFTSQGLIFTKKQFSSFFYFCYIKVALKLVNFFNAFIDYLLLSKTCWVKNNSALGEKKPLKRCKCINKQ